MHVAEDKERLVWTPKELLCLSVFMFYFVLLTILLIVI